MFKECDNCAAKAGSPTLCEVCLRSRAFWESADANKPTTMTTNKRQELRELAKQREIIEEFEYKFVADDTPDCIPKKNWQEMDTEVISFWLSKIDQAVREERERVREMVERKIKENTIEAETLDTYIMNEDFESIRNGWEHEMRKEDDELEFANGKISLLVDKNQALDDLFNQLTPNQDE